MRQQNPRRFLIDHLWPNIQFPHFLPIGWGTLCAETVRNRTVKQQWPTQSIGQTFTFFHSFFCLGTENWDIFLRNPENGSYWFT